MPSAFKLSTHHHRSCSWSAKAAMTQSSLANSPPLLLLLLLLLWSTQLHGFLTSPPQAVIRGGADGQPGPFKMCGKNINIQEPHDDAARAAPGAAVGRDQRDITWSNRGGKDLVRVADNVWCAERPFVWNSIDVGKPYALEYRCLYAIRHNTRCIGLFALLLAI